MQPEICWNSTNDAYLSIFGHCQVLILMMIWNEELPWDRKEFEFLELFSLFWACKWKPGLVRYPVHSLIFNEHDFQ